MEDKITYSYRNLISALYEFLCTYITPEVDPSQVLSGDAQNMVLPENEDYIIFTVVSQMRHGTTAEHYDADSETLALKELNEVTVKVDCYADSTNSSVAPEFFRRYGISALYADDATNTTLVSDSNQYLHRWSVNLHLSFKNTVTIPQPGFTKMQVGMNSIVTQEEAEKDPIGAGKLHVCDVDVKIPN